MTCEKKMRTCGIGVSSQRGEFFVGKGSHDMLCSDMLQGSKSKVIVISFPHPNPAPYLGGLCPIFCWSKCFGRHTA